MATEEGGGEGGEMTEYGLLLLLAACLGFEHVCSKLMLPTCCTAVPVTSHMLHCQHWANVSHMLGFDS